MKILITGSNGFIGRNLEEYFKKTKHNLFTPKRDQLNLLNKYDVEQYIKSNNFDIIIHSAVTLISIDENFQMFSNLERLSNYFGKMISIGSGAEFDKKNYIPKMREEYFGKFIPSKEDIYGYSKYLIAKKIIEEKKNIFNLRLFGIFGKYEDYRRRLISNNICRLLCGQNISINKNANFDYLYVDDFCKILENFIQKNPKSNTYNVCTGKIVDFLSIAKIIAKQFDNQCEILVKENGLNPEYSGDNTKFINEFGKFEFSNLDASVKKLFDWYRFESKLLFNEKLFDNWIKN